MAYRFRERYQAVLAKRQQLKEAGAYSTPDATGAKVAILAPFLEELVDDERDNGESFERQTAELMEHYQRLQREPFSVFGAAQADFADVLADTSVASVVVEGFGNFSAVAVPFARPRRRDARYGYLDWQHLAGMATHLKLGEFVMYTCCGFDRQFNPPFAAGVVSSFANIRAPAGKIIRAAGVQENEPLMQPITSENELDYEQIKRLFPLQRNREVPPAVPDPAYVAVRGIYNRYLNPDLHDYPRPQPIPYPDLRQYL